MKTAGGILLAKTNLPEFSYWIESDNLLSGRSNNPWDLDPHAGRVERRRVGGHRGGHVAARPRHRPRHLRARPGRADRHRLAEGDAWARADDGHLAARAAPLLACRPDGALDPRPRAGLLAAGRARTAQDAFATSTVPFDAGVGVRAGPPAAGRLDGRARLRAGRSRGRGDRAGGGRSARGRGHASWSRCASRRWSATSPSTSSTGSTSWR